jgi:hypothetical protein
MVYSEYVFKEIFGCVKEVAQTITELEEKKEALERENQQSLTAFKSRPKRQLPAKGASSLKGPSKFS